MSKKILVVEDSFHLRELLGISLTSLGSDPILAESGRESLAKLERETPSVILMDMGLPDMDGFELGGGPKKTPRFQEDTHSRNYRVSRWHSSRALSCGRLRFIYLEAVRIYCAPNQTDAAGAC